MVKKANIYMNVKMSKPERYLHTPSSFAKQNLLYVQEVGHLESLQPHRSTREKLESFLILVVLEGKGFFGVDGVEIAVGKGDCAWIDCMGKYGHISDENDAWRLAWVHFNGNNARSFYELFVKLNDSKAVFHVEDVDEWFGIIRNIMSCQREGNMFSELICGELLMHLMNKAVKCVSDSVKIGSEQAKLDAEKMREFINKQYAERNVLELVSEEFGKPMENIGATFKSIYGISLEEYVSSRRYNVAKELLRFSVKSIEAVAAESGIGDVTIMQQLFMQNEEMSAGEYRRKWAGWIRG